MLGREQQILYKKLKGKSRKQGLTEYKFAGYTVFTPTVGVKEERDSHLPGLLAPRRERISPSSGRYGRASVCA